ncbi:hypothetical protein KIN20_004400 [Parelaphostrongylus tenuis]|uniref:Uncharacterized protein n=1 Tax=Parelaphostrongylus tenuis TaxID=148309 RepID=A0AAD5QGV0_PARTN|nr:hypothetical protein KIN20_004400 [Parelaphostrongylus tenuis]
MAFHRTLLLTAGECWKVEHGSTHAAIYSKYTSAAKHQALQQNHEWSRHPKRPASQFHQKQMVFRQFGHRISTIWIFRPTANL